MRTHNRTRSLFAALAVFGLTTACLFGSGVHQAPTATALSAFAATLASASQATPTSSLAAGGSTGGIGGTGGNSSSGGSNSGTGNSNGNPTGKNSATEVDDTTEPTLLDVSPGGPYVVKQIETLGGEVISGEVCSLTKPFSVFSSTPHVGFTFYFTPQGAQGGMVTYAYTISSAGESHDASGSYSLNPASEDGTVHLSLSVSDHVVFKGFDGNIPNNYKFDLVPSTKTHC